jgi:hypothetical protein
MKKIHFHVLAIVILIALMPTTGCVTHTTVNNEPRFLLPQVSVIINDKKMEFAPEVRAKLVEEAVELLSSCIHKDLEPGRRLKDAMKESHLSVKFPSPRRVEVPVEEITVEVQEMVITLPLNSGGIWVRSDKGVIYFAKFKHTIVQELEKLLKESKHGDDA